jgi:hypothetical protein
MEEAPARPAQRRDVIGQKHEPERQHPESDKRQEAEEPPMINSAPTGMRAQREAGFLSQRVMACSRLGSCRLSRRSRRS